MTELSPEWAPVASQAVGVYGQISPDVQIFIAAGVTLVLLAAAVVVDRWLSRRSQAAAEAPADPPAPDNSDVIALAKAISSLADEQGRHVHHMAQSVDRLHDTVQQLAETIVGCTTCPWHPNQAEERKG